jgi:hypothetical protein
MWGSIVPHEVVWNKEKLDAARGLGDNLLMRLMDRIVVVVFSKLLYKGYTIGEVDFWIFLDFQFPTVCN